MRIFGSFQLAASPWHTSGHNSMIFPCHLWHFLAAFIWPLFNIPTFSSFHCYFNILIGWPMILLTVQPLGPIRRSFHHNSDTSDILFIFISPLLYLNFGITQKIKRDFSPFIYHCKYTAAASPQYTATQILTSNCALLSLASLWLCLLFHFSLTLCSFNSALLLFPLPQATHRLDIAEGSVNHYLAQLSRHSVFVVGLLTSEASLMYQCLSPLVCTSSCSCLFLSVPAHPRSFLLSLLVPACPHLSMLIPACPHLFVHGFICACSYAPVSALVCICLHSCLVAHAAFVLVCVCLFMPAFVVICTCPDSMLTLFVCIWGVD